MKKVRIAHIADFHLGEEIKTNDELKKEINKNIIQSLIQIFNMLNASRVDLVLIAGDFYESSSVDDKLLQSVKEIFSNFSGNIIISPGNHDYVSIESVYHGNWPENVHIFLNDNIEYIEFEGLDTRVYGFAFTKSHISERKLMNFPYLDQNFINIGVFHGQIDSNYNNYNPIFLEDIENSKLDYIALGHIHKRSEINKIGNTYYSYSGNPCGRGFDELGAKGIYIGEVSKGWNSLRFLKSSENEFHKLKIEIDLFESQSNIANQIKEKLIDRFGNNYKNHYYKLILKGSRNEDEYINIEMIEDFLSDIKYIEIEDETNIIIDLDSLSKEDSLRGVFVRKLIESDNFDNQDKEKILDFGLKVFEGSL